MSRLFVFLVAVFIAYPAFSQGNGDIHPNVPIDRREIIIEKGNSR